MSLDVKFTPASNCKRQCALTWLWLAGAVSLFVVAGGLMMPVLGFQYDELLFADSVLHPGQAQAHFSVGHFTIPTMLTSYLGAFKSWLFAPLFAIAGYSLGTIRVPSLVLGAATLIALYLLLREIRGARAGLIVVWLLATDVTFLLTATFDWGPVVIQNLFLVLGLLFFVRAWRQQNGGWLLFAAGLVYGLALWDKALFLWNLSGMLVMLLVLQTRLVLREARSRNAFMILVGASIGALPLIGYNLASRGTTLQANSNFTTKDVAAKFKYLGFAIDGGISAAGFSDPHYPASDQIRRPFSRISRAWDGNSSWASHSGRVWLFAILIPAGIACAARSERMWIIFFIGSAALSWFQSALTIGAGGSIHHTVLVWPLIYSAVAISLDVTAGAIGRWGSPVIYFLVAIFSYRGLFLMNHAYVTFLGFSPIPQFSNADVALVSYLQHAGIDRVVSLDWGIANPIAARTAGAISVSEDSFVLLDHQSIRQDLLTCKADPNCVFVTHPEQRELFLGVTHTLDAELLQLKLRRDPGEEIRDSHGTPTLIVFRLKEAN